MSSLPAVVPQADLAPLEEAKRIIALAVAEQDSALLFELRDQGAAFERYYQRREDGREAANDAGEIKVRAERALGKLDVEANKHGGDRKSDQVPPTRNLIDVHHDTRAAWRKLGKVSDERFDRFVASARADQEAGVSTAQLIRYLRTGSEGASVTFECYTPARYIDAAREVLGEIDLDPASSPEANETVRAAQIFTEQDDGLSHGWPGRVFLNPPYGRGLTSQFTIKLIEEFAAGRTTAAILLINAYGFDAAWFQPLWDHTLCFTDHRIPFYGGGPTFGSLFVYMGQDAERFAERFAEFGTVVRSWA